MDKKNFLNFQHRQNYDYHPEIKYHRLQDSLGSATNSEKVSGGSPLVNEQKAYPSARESLGLNTNYYRNLLNN